MFTYLNRYNTSGWQVSRNDLNFKVAALHANAWKPMQIKRSRLGKFFECFVTVIHFIFKTGARELA